GNGGNSAELLRFFDLHVMLLPAALLILLVAKMYMLEAHGVADPTSGSPAEPKPKLSPIFPDVTMYLFELSLLFGAGMLLISALFPLNLPPQYTPAAASQFIPQPDWYFLWVYQVLKIKIFEGSTGLAMALTVVSAIFVLLIILPFIDRGKNREISKRPVYTTLGVIFVTEVVVLSYWGLVTPGMIIPVEQAALVVGGTALLMAVGSALVYRLMYSRAKGRLALAPAKSIPSSELRNGLAFTGLVALGAFSVGTLVNGSAGLLMGGLSVAGLEVVSVSAVLLGLDLLGSVFLIYRLDLRTGNIKRRVRVLEAGWRGN
ncbi:MAG: cytochrome b N-terminal domain-containing protein, partial [Nitrososphaerota archaeon]|nr:cytochrome b N-terminal domain-containing protein [Nitrososphaerota archaeon]